jgi:hypothetical protein
MLVSHVDLDYLPSLCFTVNKGALFGNGSLTVHNFQPQSHLNWSGGFGLRAVPPQCGHFMVQIDIIATSHSVRI